MAGDFWDALGLSTVHVNRTLQQLRADRLIEFKSTVVRVLDWGPQPYLLMPSFLGGGLGLVTSLANTDKSLPIGASRLHMRPSRTSWTYRNALFLNRLIADRQSKGRDRKNLPLET